MKTRSLHGRGSRPRTLEEVVAEVHQLDMDGEDMDPVRLARSGHAALVSAATRHAGSWTKACRLAGVVDGQHRQRWHREKVLGHLRRRHQDGKQMSILALRRDGRSDLARASVRYFGTWSAACSRAGIKTAPQGNHRLWTRKTIIAELRRLSALGVHMSAPALSKSGHRGVVNAVHLYMSGWTSAMRQAGVPASRIPWTKDRVLHLIRQRYRAGADLSSKALQLERGGPALLWAANKYCGGWPAAVKQAGFTPANAPLWTPARTASALRQLAHQGHHMSTSALTKAGHGNIVSAAQRVHGSWRAALASAGITSPRRTVP